MAGVGSGSSGSCGRTDADVFVEDVLGESQDYERKMRILKSQIHIEQAKIEMAMAQKEVEAVNKMDQDKKDAEADKDAKVKNVHGNAKVKDAKVKDAKRIKSNLFEDCKETQVWNVDHYEKIHGDWKTNGMGHRYGELDGVKGIIVPPP